MVAAWVSTARRTWRSSVPASSSACSRACCLSAAMAAPSSEGWRAGTSSSVKTAGSGSTTVCCRRRVRAESTSSRRSAQAAVVAGAAPMAARARGPSVARVCSSEPRSCAARLTSMPCMAGQHARAPLAVVSKSVTTRATLGDHGPYHKKSEGRRGRIKTWCRCDAVPAATRFKKSNSAVARMHAAQRRYRE